MPAGEPASTGPKQSGRFQPGQSGNPAGRAKGARHKALLALDAIGAKGAQAVLRRVVQDARAGDMRAAEILLRRLWPERRGRPVTIDLPPIISGADAVKASAAIVAAAAAGSLTPDEAATIGTLIETQRRAIETQDLAARIAALEQAQHEEDER